MKQGKRYVSKRPTKQVKMINVMHHWPNYQVMPLFLSLQYQNQFSLFLVEVILDQNVTAREEKVVPIALTECISVIHIRLCTRTCINIKVTYIACLHSKCFLPICVLYKVTICCSITMCLTCCLYCQKTNRVPIYKFTNFIIYKLGSILTVCR